VSSPPDAASRGNRAAAPGRSRATPSSGRHAATPAGKRAAAGWALAALLVAAVAVFHHGIGPVPEGGAKSWYEPTGFLRQIPALSPLFASSPWAFAACIGSSCLLGLGVFALSHSAWARAVAITSIAATALLVFYGVVAPFAWNFFGWRGSATILLTAASCGLALSAPWLAASWLRLDWSRRALSYTPFAFAGVALIRNATGTDPELPFSISPWPAIPVFGLEIGALFAAVCFVGVAAASAGIAAARSRPRGRAAAATLSALLGVLVPVAILAGGARLGLFPFHVGLGTLAGVATLCGLALAGVVRVGGTHEAETLRRRARQIAVAAALVALPLLAGQVLARIDYHRTREVLARDIIDALDRYLVREAVYPDTLDAQTAAGDLDRVPTPAIGFRFLGDAAFRYVNFGTSYLLEFEAPRWVECAYSPPYEDEEPDEGDGHVAGDEPWSCPTKPPELW
jgi:cation transporter-like permease